MNKVNEREFTTEDFKLPMAVPSGCVKLNDSLMQNSYMNMIEAFFGIK